MSDAELRLLERAVLLDPEDALLRQRLRAARERLDPEAWALERWASERQALLLGTGVGTRELRLAAAAALSQGSWWFSLPYAERGRDENVVRRANRFVVVAVLIAGDAIGIGVRALRSTHGLGVRPVVMAGEAWRSLYHVRRTHELLRERRTYHDQAVNAWLGSRTATKHVTTVAVIRRWLDLPRETP